MKPLKITLIFSLAIFAAAALTIAAQNSAAPADTKTENAPAKRIKLNKRPVKAPGDKKAAGHKGQTVFFPADFEAQGFRSVTSQEHPGNADLSKVKVFKRGAKIRMDFLGHNDRVFSTQIVDLDRKLFQDLNVLDKSYSETALTPLADTWMNIGFPIGKHTLEKSAGQKDESCTYYKVKPAFGTEDMAAWDSVKTRMSVCLNPDGSPALSIVSTVEKNGSEWKNILTLEQFQAGAPQVWFAPPDDYRKIP
ncbi:MAG: hypothetical protein NTX59_06520 [Elusimicrobia bacterium]|nr:hypothetical protein [Elusimicrobiota bacterium]